MRYILEIYQHINFTDLLEMQKCQKYKTNIKKNEFRRYKNVCFKY